MDVAETARGYWNVLRKYLDMEVNFGPLATEAGFCPGRSPAGQGGRLRGGVRIPVAEGLWVPAGEKFPWMSRR